jgi:hypothetical protein
LGAELSPKVKHWFQNKADQGQKTHFIRGLVPKTLRYALLSPAASAEQKKAFEKIIPSGERHLHKPSQRQKTGSSNTHCPHYHSHPPEIHGLW